MIKIIQSAVLSFFFFFSTLVYAGAVNINTADAESLASGMNGVGDRIDRKLGSGQPPGIGD